MTKWIVCLQGIALLVFAAIASDETTASTHLPQAVLHFPGSSPRAVNLTPDNGISFKVTSDAGWAVWWFFGVEQIAPQTPLLLRDGNISSPVVSEDRKTWRYFERNKPVIIASNKAWFAWYVPYLLEDAQELTRSLVEAKRPVQTRELCRSEGGFPVPLLEIREPAERPKPVLWIQARQHAWEVGGSWTAHGVALWAASDDPQAKALRSRVDMIIVPIMDVDNVQRGNGGKDQKPHDHNRDWTDTPHWASVRAAQGELRKLVTEKRLRLFIDMHDPGYQGKGVEYWIDSLKALTPVALASTSRLADIYKKGFLSAYTYSGFHETGLHYGGGHTAGSWTRILTGHDLVDGSLEIPVGPPKGFNQPPPTQHLLLGADIGRCLSQWLIAEETALPKKDAAQ